MAYSITYNSNGGSSIATATNQTNLPSPLPTPTKSSGSFWYDISSIFCGWYYNNIFTQPAHAGDTLNVNVTLYAKWYDTMADFYEDIASEIRRKELSDNPIKHVDFVDRIRELPSPKEEETKTVTPNFASGNQVITPTSGKVMTQVTINKDTTNHIAENIKDGVTLYGVTGNLVSSSGYTVIIIGYTYDTSQGYLSYSLDNGATWVDITNASQLNIILNNVTQIQFKLTNTSRMYASLLDRTKIFDHVSIVLGQGSNWTGSNIILSENKIYEIIIMED